MPVFTDVSNNFFSDAVSTIYYDANEATLYVELQSGSVYGYQDVPRYVYDNFVSADSKGRYYHNNVRGVYRPTGEVENNFTHRAPEVQDVTTAEKVDLETLTPEETVVGEAENVTVGSNSNRYLVFFQVSYTQEVDAPTDQTAIDTVYATYAEQPNLKVTEVRRVL